MKWNDVEKKHDNKIIIVINFHWLPNGSKKGLTTFLLQNNRMMGAEHTSKKTHRPDLFSEIKELLHGMNNDK